MKHILIILLLFWVAVSNSQNVIIDSTIHFDNNELAQLRIDENIFHCDINPFGKGDNPLFTDERNFKINMTLKNSKTKKEVNLYDPEPDICNLKIVAQSVLLNISKKTIEISGYISGGWYGAGSQIYIYVGQRIDTTTYIYLSPSIERKIYFNGKILRRPVVVDTLPSFYLKNYVSSISEVGYNDHPERAFRIVAPIQEKSYLIFGLSSCYSEIFEIGKLLKFNNPY